MVTMCGLSYCVSCGFTHSTAKPNSWCLIFLGLIVALRRLDNWPDLTVYMVIFVLPIVPYTHYTVCIWPWPTLQILCCVCFEGYFAFCEVQDMIGTPRGRAWEMLLVLRALLILVCVAWCGCAKAPVCQLCFL
jgi:hypothetical protein